MTVSLTPLPRFKAFIAGTNAPLSAGKLYTYAAGTTTPLATYTSSTGLSSNTNPVILDINGEADVWLGNSAYKLVLKDANGNTLWTVDGIIRSSTYTEFSALSASFTAYQTNLSSKVYGSQGASFVGYNFSLNQVGRLVSQALQDRVSIKDFGAIGDGNSHPLSGVYSTLLSAQVAYPFVTSLSWELDHAATQAAVNTGKMAYAPRGIYLIDTDYGVTLSSGNAVIGDGILNTVFLAKPNGATLPQLQNYTKGSVFKRSFVLGTNASLQPDRYYVDGVYIGHLSVILNPKTPINIVSNYLQIGVDLRHITRSKIDNVFSGSLNFPGCIYVSTVSNADSIQGYGFALGTQSGGAIDYCGGEVNTLEKCFGWGAFKSITIDDSLLMSNSGGSSAHASAIIDCDTQGAHTLISQESRFTAGVTVKGGVHQACIRQTGNPDPTNVLAITGYNGNYEIDYIEAGSDCDKILSLGSLSNNNIVDLPCYSHTSSAISGGKITDAGTKNLIRTFLAQPITGGETSKGGDYYELFNQGYRKVFASFAWSGASVTVNSKIGVLTIGRNSLGNYTVNLSNNMPNAFWIPSICLNTDGSGHGGLVDIISKGIGSITFVTYIQNGGTTTQIDPVEICFIGIQN